MEHEAPCVKKMCGLDRGRRQVSICAHCLHKNTLLRTASANLAIFRIFLWPIRFSSRSDPSRPSLLQGYARPGAQVKSSHAPGGIGPFRAGLCTRIWWACLDQFWGGLDQISAAFDQFGRGSTNFGEAPTNSGPTRPNLGKLRPNLGGSPPIQPCSTKFGSCRPKVDWLRPDLGRFRPNLVCPHRFCVCVRARVVMSAAPDTPVFLWRSPLCRRTFGKTQRGRR